MALVGVLVVGAALATSAPRIGEARADGRAAAEGPSAPASTGVPGAEELGALLPRVAAHAARFEQMKRRGSYTVAGRIDRIDGDGKLDGRTEIIARITATGTDVPTTDLVRYVEDGKDKTSEARTKVRERAAKRNSEEKRAFRLPFLASEQPRYTFRILEHDSARAARVRVAFVPRTPAEDAYKGSAWIDLASGEVETMGFSLSKNPTFVDHVDVTIVFGLATPLGRAPSTIGFDARGGFLFIKKRYRGSATITDPRVTL